MFWKHVGILPQYSIQVIKQFGRRTQWKYNLYNYQQFALNTSSRNNGKYYIQLENYRNAGQWKEILHLLEELDNKGHHLDQEIYSIAIDTCLRSGQHGIVIGLLRNMAQDKIIPNDNLMEALFDIFAIKENEDQVVHLVNVITSTNKPIQIKTFRKSLYAIGKTQDSDKLKLLLQNVFSNKLKLKENDYASIMRTCGSTNRIDLIQMVFNHMDEKGIDPTKEVYSNAIKALLNNDALTPALHLIGSIDDTIQLDENVYSAAINQCEKEGNTWAAREIYERLIEKKIEPTQKTSISCLLSIINARDETSAWEQWNFIKEKFHDTIDKNAIENCIYQSVKLYFPELAYDMFKYLEQDHQYQITPRALGSVIRGLGKSLQVNEAIKLYESYRNQTSVPQVSVYLAALYAASQSQDSILVNKIWQDMKETNAINYLHPNGFVASVSAFASIGDVNQVMDIIRCQMKKKEHESNEYLYGSALIGFSKSKHVDEIMAMMEIMKELNYPITDTVLNTICKTCLEENRDDALIMIFNLIQDKNSIIQLKTANMTMGLILSELAKHEKWNTFHSWYFYCLQNKIPARIQDIPLILETLQNSNNYMTCFNLASVLTTYGKINESNSKGISAAMKVCFHSLQYHLTWTLYINLLRRGERDERAHKYATLASLVTKKYDKALEVCESFYDHEYELNEDMASIILTVYSYVGKKENEMKELWKIMKQSNFQPSSFAYHSMLLMYFKQKEYNHCMEIINEMKENKKKIPQSSKHLIWQSVLNQEVNPSFNELNKIYKLIGGDFPFLISKLILQNQSALAYQVLGDIIQKDSKINNLSQVQIMNWIRQLKENSFQVFTVLHQLSKMEMEINENILSFAFQTLNISSKNNLNEIMPLMNHLIQWYPTLISSKSISYLCNYMFEQKAFKELFSLLKPIGLYETQYETIIHECNANEEYALSLEFYERSRHSFIQPTISMDCDCLIAAYFLKNEKYLQEIILKIEKLQFHSKIEQLIQKQLNDDQKQFKKNKKNKLKQKNNQNTLQLIILLLENNISLNSKLIHQVIEYHQQQQQEKEQVEEDVCSTLEHHHQQQQQMEQLQRLTSLMNKF